MRAVLAWQLLPGAPHAAHCPQRQCPGPRAAGRPQGVARRRPPPALLARHALTPASPGRSCTKPCGRSSRRWWWIWPLTAAPSSTSLSHCGSDQTQRGACRSLRHAAMMSCRHAMPLPCKEHPHGGRHDIKALIHALPRLDAGPEDRNAPFASGCGQVRVSEVGACHGVTAIQVLPPHKGRGRRHQIHGRGAFLPWLGLGRPVPTRPLPTIFPSWKVQKTKKTATKEPDTVSSAIAQLKAEGPKYTCVGCSA